MTFLSLLFIKFLYFKMCSESKQSKAFQAFSHMLILTNPTKLNLPDLLLDKSIFLSGKHFL